VEDENIIPIAEIPFGEIVSYDNQVFPTNREVFLREWFKQPESLAIAYRVDGKLSGYGMVRKCRTGFKVGPLFADNEKIADTLLQKMRSFVGEDSQIFLDTPEVNKEAVALAEKYKMKPMFETARMYTKNQPNVDLKKVFGVTTF